MSTPPERRNVEDIVKTQSQLIPWVAVVGLLIGGISGLVGGIAALADAGPQQPLLYIGAGACLTAATLGFGLLTNAIYRR